MNHGGLTCPFADDGSNAFGFELVLVSRSLLIMSADGADIDCSFWALACCPEVDDGLDQGSNMHLGLYVLVYARLDWI